MVATTLKLYGGEKTGILSSSTPSFTRLAIKGVKQSDNQGSNCYNKF